MVRKDVMKNPIVVNKLKFTKFTNVRSMIFQISNIEN